MQFLIRVVLILIAVVFFVPELSWASIIFKPGQKAEYVAPGEEEISGNAAEIWQTAQTAEKENNLKRAIKAYKALVKRHPKDALAPNAIFRAAQLQEQVRALGHEPETGGSVSGAIHRGWVEVKSAVTGRDAKAILEECERGEDYAKARYADVLKRDLPTQLREIVQRQYEGVLSNHDRIRRLRDQYKETA